ncbi:Ig-like domain repeat protein [Corynebacterium urinipleomorphum]|uniref:Ig-like domain repeat protein n=1 Tax=Corynebacterium urinipleomorphum TaxID=1852380 RepID=UPI000B360CDF|nr:Ig-like domain repeat protein [Corynebacterium urinipleomorphum]
MTRRLPFRTAIAGLTALALTAPVIAPANTTTLAAAIAQVREDSANPLAFTERPATVKINEDANFTVRVPNADGGSVQFFLDNVAQGDPVKVVGDHVAITVNPKSYLDHTVTARYVDADGFNPRADVTAEFKTPIEGGPNRKGNGGATDNEYTSNKYSSTVNNQTGTASKPVSVQPGSEITVKGNMTMNSRSVVYDYGINPAPGATYQSGRTLVPQQTKLKATGNWPGSDLTVNPGFFVINIDPGWSSFGYTGTLSVEGKFKAPTVPGVYFSELASYKYRTNDTYFLQRLDDSVYRVEAPKLPGRNQRTASTIELPADQSFIAGTAGELTANVTAADAKGTVVFTSGGNELGRADVQNGTATATVTFPNAGAPTVTATFIPAAGTNWAQSETSGTVTVTEPASMKDTKLSFEGSPTTATIGEETLLTATVADNVPGTVQFYEVTNEGETPIGAPAELTETTSAATLPYTPSSAGQKTIKAVFTPADTAAFRETEAEWQVDVDKRNVQLTLTADADKKAGEPITVSATVDPDVAGTVTFLNGEEEIGTADVENGVATMSDTFIAGRHQLKAVFTPTDADTYNNTDASHSLVVGSRQKKDTSLELTASPVEVTLGETTTITATVTKGAPGRVAFTDEDGVQGWATVNNGTATYSYTPKSTGNKTVKAEFIPSGEAVDTHNGSTAEINVNVNDVPAGAAQETGLVLSGPTQVTSGENFNLTAAVSPKGATGSVEFFNGDETLGTAEISDGKATLPVEGLAQGAYEFKATFTDPNNKFAESEDTFSVKVEDEKAPVTVTETSTATETSTVTESTTATEFSTVTEKTTTTEPTTLRETETKTETATTTEPTTVRETETKTETATNTQPTTVTSVTTEPTTVRETETKTETATTTQPTTVTSVTTEPTTVRETETKTETATTTQPTTVTSVTTEPTTVRETETKTETATTTQPTTVTSVTTEPTTVRETETKTETATTTQPTTVTSVTTEPTTLREMETKTETATTTEPTTVRETETKTETATTTQPTTVTSVTTEPTTLRETETKTETATTTQPTTVRETETKTETATTTQPTTVTSVTTEPTTVRETETKTETTVVTTTQSTTVTNTTTTTQPTTVTNTATETTTKTSVSVQPTTLRETETKTQTTTTTQPTTSTATTTERATETTTATQPPVTATVTTTEKAGALKPAVPAAPAVDASRIVETRNGREISLTAGTTPGTQGKMIFELTDGTRLGEAPVRKDGMAKFTHTFTKPGVYTIQSYVLDERGVAGDKSVPYTVTVAEKATNGTGSNQGSSLKLDAKSKRGLAFGIGGVVLTAVFGGLLFAVLNLPVVRDFLKRYGIHF